MFLSKVSAGLMNSSKSIFLLKKESQYVEWPWLILKCKIFCFVCYALLLLQQIIFLLQSSRSSKFKATVFHLRTAESKDNIESYFYLSLQISF